MKKIINGKKYDTETAKEVGYYTNGGTCSDFTHIEETLYQKVTGEFFIHAWGGAKSAYARPTSPGWWGAGEELIPITEEEAKEWAEKHLSGDEYEAIFGEVAE